jgi:hypothetical protein
MRAQPATTVGFLFLTTTAAYGYASIPHPSAAIRSQLALVGLSPCVRIG